FAFCVALYEALYGHRPFAGSSYAELLTTVQAGQLVPEPKSTVPTWLRKILLRGLSVDPNTRYPAMADLLAALGRDPARRRRRFALGAAATAIAAVAVVLGVTRTQSDAAAPCEGGDERLAGIWDAAAKQRVHDGLLASKRKHAPETWKRVAAEL